MLNFIRCLFSSIEMIMCFCLFFVDVVYHIDLCILVPRTILCLKDESNLIVVHDLCWIQLVNILSRISVSIFFKDIGLYLIVVHDLCWIQLVNILSRISVSGFFKDIGL
ncbi:unnamed protein product [Rangifer tarandus platyrhynchus]|uniref:Uncharacterized protein n=1 Tax=Rangifer tarandus platyrhynchus TaxID=3082113 RepID=A0AC59ZCF7_RANTA